MPQKFDAASKHMIDAYPGDWIALGGLPAGAEMEILDTDLSAVTMAADKLIRVYAPEPYVAHIEFQSGPDPSLDVRTLTYNVAGRRRLGMPVKSVVFLMRPQAMTPGVTGRVSDISDPSHRLDFRYKLVKVWEIDPGRLLNAGIGTLPIAPISKVSKSELPSVIEGMERRLANDVAPEEAAEIWTATRILMGLRYSRQMVQSLLAGAKAMEDSTTYQEIIEKGEARGIERGLERGLKRGIEHGRVAEARQIIVRMGTKHFGPPDVPTRETLESITDLHRLEDLIDRLLDATCTGWAQLLASAP